MWLHHAQRASQPLRNTNPCLILSLQVRSPLTMHAMIRWRGMRKQALAKEVFETGDRVGALLPRRLCLLSKPLLAASGSNGVKLALKQISTIHDDDAALCNTMRANISTIRSASAPGPQLTPQNLATNWGINVRTPTRTVQATTQRGIRMVLHPTLSRRFRTNNSQLRYEQLPIDCFFNTLLSNTTSRRNN